MAITFNNHILTHFHSTQYKLRPAKTAWREVVSYHSFCSRCYLRYLYYVSRTSPYNLVWTLKSRLSSLTLLLVSKIVEEEEDIKDKDYEVDDENDQKHERARVT